MSFTFVFVTALAVCTNAHVGHHYSQSLGYSGFTSGYYGYSLPSAHHQDYSGLISKAGYNFLSTNSVPSFSGSFSFPSHYRGGYSLPLGYSVPSHSTFSHHPSISQYSSYHHSKYMQPSPIVHQTYSPPQVYSVPVHKTIRHEPDVSEYSTTVETSPAIHKTRISHPPPVVHESYTAPIIHNTVVPTQVAAVPIVNQESTNSEYFTATAFTNTNIAHERYSAPIAHKTVEHAPFAPIAPTVKIAHEPTISEFSTYTASAPAFTKTKVIPQAPLVHERYSAPIVHKTSAPVAQEPTISEYSTYDASAPVFTNTKVISQAPVVHESYNAPVVHKTVEAATVAEAVVKTVAHEPTISEYSTYTASAPAFTKTDVIPQAPVVHESYSPPIIHKTVQAASVPIQAAPVAIQAEPVPFQAAPLPPVVPSVVKTVAHEPTISEFSTYTASAPPFEHTKIAEQAPVVRERYSPGFIHKTVEPVPLEKTYGAPAASYAPPAY